MPVWKTQIVPRARVEDSDRFQGPCGRLRSFPGPVWKTQIVPRARLRKRTISACSLRLDQV